jgi:hypothetical protein
VSKVYEKLKQFLNANKDYYRRVISKALNIPRDNTPKKLLTRIPELKNVPSSIFEKVIFDGSNVTEFTDEDYEWAANQIYKDFGKTPSDELGIATVKQWNDILKQMGGPLLKKKPKDLTRKELIWFLTFYKFIGKKHGINDGISLLHAIDKEEVTNFYWKIILSQKENTGVTQLMGGISFEKFAKAVRPRVDEFLKSGQYDISFPSVIMEDNKGFSLMSIEPVLSKYAGGTFEPGWFKNHKTLSESTLKNPIYANFGNLAGKSFSKRRYGNKIGNSIDKVFKPALEKGIAALKTIEGAKLQIFPNNPSWRGNTDMNGVTTYDIKNAKAPGGLPQSVSDLRNLPEDKSSNKSIYDAIEAIIQGKYIEFIQESDKKTINFQADKMAGNNLNKYYEGATQWQSFGKAADEAGKIITNLFMSTVLRSTMQIFWEDFGEKAQEAKKAAAPNPVNQEALDKLGKAAAEAMAGAEAKAASNLAAGAGKADAAAAANDEDSLADEEELEEKRRYLKQCALITNFSLLKEKYQKKILAGGGAAEYFKGSEKSPEPRFYMIDTNNNDKRNILNHLITPKYDDISAFMKLTPDLVSALTPKIRIFKIWNSSNCTLQEQEFPFLHYEDPSRISNLRNIQETQPTKSNPYPEIIDRGGGVGIKSLNFTFEGTNPGDARSAIAVELTMFFQSFSELVRERDGKTGKWKYVDLMLHPHDTKAKEKIDPQSTVHNPYKVGGVENYRIRLDLGWNKISGRQKDIFDERTQSIDGVSSDSVNEAIRRINKSYYLVMVDHEFDITDSGNVEVKVNFRAYIETALQDKKIDALSSPAIIAHRANFGKELDKLLVEKKCTLQQFRELRATYAAIDEEFRITAYRSIMKRMLDRGHVHVCKIDRSDVGPKFKTRGGRIFEKAPKLQFLSGESLNENKKSPDKIERDEKKSTKDKATQATESAQKNKVAANKDKAANAATSSPKKKDKEMPSNKTFTQLPSLKDAEDNVSFFMLGDLIHTILDCMYEPLIPVGDGLDPDLFTKIDSPEANKVGKRLCHLNNTSILLPSFELTSPEEGKEDETISMNVAEIPVAVNYFYEFMTEKVIKGKRKSYPLMNMLRDLTREIVVNILSERCTDLRNVKKLSFAHTSFVSVNQDSGEDLMNHLLKNPKYSRDGIYVLSDTAHKASKLPIPAVESHMESSKFRNYLVFFPKSGSDKHNGTGNIDQDHEAGVYHFEIGANRGILKKIKFSKTDMQYLREARFMQQGNDGLLQLGAVYKATLDLVGNTIYYPGMSLWIEPTSLGTGYDMDPRTGGKNRSAANALGFGGYHMVTRVQGSISPGKFNTTVDALFTYSGDGEESTTRPKNSTPKKDKNVGPDGKTAKPGEKGLKTKDNEVVSNEEFARCNSFINKRQQQLQTLATLADKISGLSATNNIVTNTATQEAIAANPTSTVAKNQASEVKKGEKPPAGIGGAKKYSTDENPNVWDNNSQSWQEAYWEKDGVLFTKDGRRLEHGPAPAGAPPQPS